MNRFTTKDELIKAFARSAAYPVSLFRKMDQGLDIDAAMIYATNSCCYVPHLYRGGWVIPGFGYSIERIGKYVSTENAGNPEVVAIAAFSSTGVTQ